MTDLILRKAYDLTNRAVLQLARWRFRKPPDWCRRIAFSEQESWEPVLRNGFAGWSIDIVFANIPDLALEEFDLVVPLNVDDALWLAAQPVFNARNPIPMPSTEVINLCDDKQAFSNALVAAGFGMHVPLRATPTVYPYILKKRRDHSSISTQIIRDAADERGLRNLAQDPEYFTQQLVLGCREYATHISFIGDSVVSELTLEYTFPTDQGIKLRSPVLYRRYTRCPDLALLVGILRALRFEGLCCFNYKLARGRVVVFELNPRLGGTLCPYFFAFVGALAGPRR